MSYYWTAVVQFTAGVNLSFLHNVHTDPVAHTILLLFIAYPGKSAPNLKLTTHFHLEPRLRMVEL
jgi:hypothetical protein